nr:probable receptor-like protein kinase At2g23200 [Tanacetum cinerariifolium]
GFLIGSKYGKKPKPVTGAKSESNAVPSYGQSSYTSINIDFTINHPSPIPNLNLNLKFAFADILTATNNFDEKLMIGKGGFGKVYKGTLPDGMIVAVKRGEKGHGQGRPEFVTEIMVLSKIRHRHLVTLIGYCDEKSEMILVYEFMKKGTLQDHLYDTKKDLPKLSWTQRLEICISATRGLHYLHTGSDAGIIHRDVKSTNILLNENYVAKVADFGISRLDNVEEDEISDIKGSFGYLDPEYIRCMKLTQKSDVYSFGVVLLEVLCARPALDNTLPPREANLADWAIKQIHNGKVEEIIDPFLLDTINPNSLRKFLETVERCLKDTGDERPSMIDVLWDLEYALKLHQMVVNREPHEDSTMNTSLQLPMSMIQRLPSNVNDDSEVIDSSASSFPSESQVFSQLKMDEAR